MSQMSERHLELVREEWNCMEEQIAYEEMYLINIVVEAAEACANDAELFELFIRTIHENKQRS